MIGIFGNIESIAHGAIDKLGKAAIGLAKAVVTIFCLGASVSYTTGTKLRKAVDNYYQEPTIQHEDKTYQETNAKEDAVNATYCEISSDTTDTQVEEREIELSELVDLTQGIVTIIETINLVKPIVNNSLEDFLTEALKDILESNFLEVATYKLPNNKRVRTKTHTRFQDLGVMKEYYPVLTATGILC